MQLSQIKPMTVGELVDELKNVPFDTPVVVGSFQECSDGERDDYRFHPATCFHRHWNNPDLQQPLVIEAPRNTCCEGG